MQVGHYAALLAVFVGENARLVPVALVRFLLELELDIVLVEAADDVLHDLRALALCHPARYVVFRPTAVRVVLVPLVFSVLASALAS